MIDWVDLFAGPGGWDVAARELGIEPLGIEWDEAACMTRDAAKLRTSDRRDVSECDPLEWGPCRGLIASPPCPTFSAAGGRLGNSLTDLLKDAIADLAAGRDTRSERRREAFTALEPLALEAERKRAEKKGQEPRLGVARETARHNAITSLLVAEPMRWITALEPEFVALEQVPEVLPLWEAVAGHLRERGYGAWTGVLHAEQYGVAQTRKRAVLMARLGAKVEPPPPTHRKYVAPKQRKAESTFEEAMLEPWITMADALGWGMTERPYPVIACSSSTGGPDKEKVGGSGARRQLYAERDRGAWVERPAPTIVGTRRSEEGIIVGRTEGSCRLPRGEGRNVGGWPEERPATAVCGDPRVSPPGYRGRAADYADDGTYEGERSKAIRVTLEEAAILQSFPPDYPFQGNKTKRFQQVGNAIPPLLARAILSQLIRPGL